MGDIGGRGRGQERVGGASGRRAMREVGGGGAGEVESEGWIGGSGGSDATSDAGTEESEGEHALLTLSPCGTQESGARWLRGYARASGSDGRKGTSTTAGGWGTRGRHGERENIGMKRETAWVGKVQTPGEWGGTLGAAIPP